MQTPEAIDRVLEDLARLMAEKLELRPAPFGKLVRKAAPRLPRAVRNQAQALAEAQEMARNPRLAPTLDMAAVTRAAHDLKAHLNRIDVADLRRGRRLAVLGSVSANLIAVFVLVLAVLVWRGFV